MRGYDGGGGIGSELGLEVRVRKCSAECSVRLPNGIIQIGRVLTKSAMQLGRDEARLALHERRIILPDFEKARLVRLIERETFTRTTGLASIPS